MPIGSTNIGLGSTIKTEMGQSSGKQTSLKDVSTGNVETINVASVNRPDGSAPYAMSEFAGYDHNYSLTSWTGGDVQTSPANACLTLADSTYYHDGSNSDPALGDNVYSDSIGKSDLSNGSYRTSTGYLTVTSGVVTATGACGRGGRSERRYKQNIKQIGTSPMGIPVYEFEYKNKLYGSGKYVGTMVDDLMRLGFESALYTLNNETWVDYDKIDVPFEKIYK